MQRGLTFIPNTGGKRHGDELGGNAKRAKKAVDEAAVTKKKTMAGELLDPIDADDDKEGEEEDDDDEEEEEVDDDDDDDKEEDEEDEGEDEEDEGEEYVGTMTPEIFEQIARGAIGKASLSGVSLSDLRYLLSALKLPLCRLTDLR